LAELFLPGLIQDCITNCAAMLNGILDCCARDRLGRAQEAGVAEWSKHHSFSELNERTHDAETYALAAFELAVATSDEAAEAALEALLARSDAKSAALPPNREPGEEQVSGQTKAGADALHACGANLRLTRKRSGQKGSPSPA
jgi:hypothetical protein